MDDYAAWRSRVLRSNSTRFSSPSFANAAFTTAGTPSTAAAADLHSNNKKSHSADGSVDDAVATARLSEVLQDIIATERGQEKVWLNVQPCVLHTIKLLIAAAQSRATRLRELEHAVEQAQACLAVLVRDRDVKEERYRLDTAAHQAETEQLWKRMLLLEAQQQQQQQQQPACSTQPLSASAVESRVHALEQGLQCVESQLRLLTVPGHERTKQAGQSRSFSSSSSASSTVKRDDVNKTVSAATPSQEKNNANRGSHSPVTGRMLEEVHRLRRQWKHFLETVPASLRKSEDEDGGALKERQRRRQADQQDPRPCYDKSGQGCASTMPRRAKSRPISRPQEPLSADDVQSDTDIYADSAYDQNDDEHHYAQLADGFTDIQYATSTSADLPFSSCGRRVRWYWASGASSTSPFSSYPSSAQRAQHGGALASAANLAVPWAEWHVFDGRTSCWHSLGDWATHHHQMEALRQSDATHHRDEPSRLGWMLRTTALVAWPRPTRLTVRRGGIYQVRVCLVRHCASGGNVSPREQLDKEDNVLSLWVNGVAVTGLCERVNHTLLYTQTTTAATTTPPTRHRRSPSPRRTRATVSLTAAATASRAKAQGRSSSLFAYSSSFLPQHTQMEEAYHVLLRRPCCQPAQIYTHTIVACLYLPADVTLQVRCRELHNGPKVVHEAFCELTYLV